MNHHEHPPEYHPAPWWFHPTLMPQMQSIIGDNSVPARVQLAAQFSLHMARRAGPIVAMNDVGFDREEPAPVTIEEHLAWKEACTLLTNYFAGAFKPDPLELQRYRGIETEMMRRSVGRVLRCPACMGAPAEKVAECGVCNGSGEVLMMPHGTPKQEATPANESESEGES